MMDSVLLSQRLIQPGTFNTGAEAENRFMDAMAQAGVEYEQNPKLFKEAGIWAFQPDFLVAKKKIVEMKFQGPAGNAHERAYKAYMPGLIKSVKPVLGLKQEDEYPMYTIFTGEMINKNYIVKQIEQNFEPDKYFLWDGQVSSAKSIIDKMTS